MTYTQTITGGRVRLIDTASRAFASVDLVLALALVLRKEHTVLVVFRPRDRRPQERA